jgi:hypothetical protein
MAILVSSPCTTSILCGCLAFAFPAVPHFSNHYLRVAGSPTRTTTAACIKGSTVRHLTVKKIQELPNGGFSRWIRRRHTITKKVPSP